MEAMGAAIQCGALVFSAFGSASLIWCCSPCSRHLSIRQLWHLGVADFGHSVVQLFGEIPVLMLREKPFTQPITAEAMRALVHFCIFATCLVETQIAAGVTVSSLRGLRVARWMAAGLPLTWPIAALCLLIEVFVPDIGILQTTTVLPSGEVSGSSLFVGVFVAACFFVSMAFYVAAITMFVRTPSPSIVVRRAYRRALVYPANFAVTFLPTWFLYIGILPVGGSFDGSDTALGIVRATCLYSNGWVNALTYLLQNIHCSHGEHCREHCRGQVQSQSLCVGFGTASVSMMSEAALTSSASAGPSPVEGAPFDWADISFN